MIAAVNGVLLTPEDAEFIVGALDEFARVLAERSAKPTPKLAHTLAQLRKATQKCGGPRANATAAASSRADQADPINDYGHATVSTTEAARILGIGANAVRAMAQRNPRKLGSRRVGSRWQHDLVRVEHRAGRAKGR